VECRIGGADLNPYLAFAGLIASGLDGVEQKLSLEAEFRGDAYGGGVPLLAKTLREALADLEKSKALTSAFGKDVIEHYLHTGRWEQMEYDRRVTDWEVARGFERA
jgi:glutamine synthetase